MSKANAYVVPVVMIHKMKVTPNENGNRAERRAAKKLKKKKGK